MWPVRLKLPGVEGAFASCCWAENYSQAPRFYSCTLFCCDFLAIAALACLDNKVWWSGSVDIHEMAGAIG